MDTPRLQPLRVAVSALLVAVLIPAIALADKGAPKRRRSSPPKYQVVANYVDLTVLLERNSMYTPSGMQAERASRLQARYERKLRERRRRRRQAKLRAERLARQRAAQAAQDAPAASAVPAPAPRYTPPAPSSGSVNWDAIAACESGGRWDLNSGNGFWGGLQFTPGTWFAYGGGPFDGSGPFPYSRSAQIAVAERVLAGQGIGAWPYCGRYG